MDKSQVTIAEIGKDRLELISRPGRFRPSQLRVPTHADVAAVEVSYTEADRATWLAKDSDQ